MAELETVRAVHSPPRVFTDPKLKNFPSPPHPEMLPREPHHLPDYPHLHVTAAWEIQQNIRLEGVWLRIHSFPQARRE